MAAASNLVVEKVHTVNSISDILTKTIDRKTLGKHLKTMACPERAEAVDVTA